MICYVLAMGKQHLGPHVVVGYGIKNFCAQASSLRHQITWKKQHATCSDKHDNNTDVGKQNSLNLTFRVKTRLCKHGKVLYCQEVVCLISQLCGCTSCSIQAKNSQRATQSFSCRKVNKGEKKLLLKIDPAHLISNAGCLIFQGSLTYSKNIKETDRDKMKLKFNLSFWYSLPLIQTLSQNP